jgi:hypothetical protein
MADEPSSISVIVCRRAEDKTCSSCNRSTKRFALCDFDIKTRRGTMSTCDRIVCADCATKSSDRHYCPAHANLVAPSTPNLPKKPPGRR